MKGAFKLHLTSMRCRLLVPAVHLLCTCLAACTEYLAAPCLLNNKLGTSVVLSNLQEKQKELAAAPRKIISYLKPNMTVAVVDDFQVYGAKAIPAQVRTGLGCTCLLRLEPG